MTRCKRPIVGLTLAVLALVSPAASGAELPAVGSAGWNAAIEVSASHWGVLPCGGDIEYAWRSLPAGVVGYASWVRSGIAPTDPGAFRSCRIELDPETDLTLPFFCTALAHEIGHLHGLGHDEDPDSLMAASMSAPLPACVQAMGPFDAPTQTADSTSAKPSAKKAKRPTKRGKRSKPSRSGADKRGRRKHRPRARATTVSDRV